MRGPPVAPPAGSPAQFGLPSPRRSAAGGACPLRGAPKDLVDALAQGALCSNPLLARVFGIKREAAPMLLTRWNRLLQLSACVFSSRLVSPPLAPTIGPRSPSPPNLVLLLLRFSTAALSLTPAPATTEPAPAPALTPAPLASPRPGAGAPRAGRQDIAGNFAGARPILFDDLRQLAVIGLLKAAAPPSMVTGWGARFALRPHLTQREITH